MMTQRPLFALLIGINRYASTTVPDLAGCENDVLAFRTLLQEHFGVAADAITVLLNEIATRDAIRTAFRERLLAPLQAWAANKPPAQDASEQPAILFYFSGHGSQAPATDKPAGLDETLVPHDSRTNGVYDIKDRELGIWLAELTKYTTNVTVILDCCHSGSATRTGDKKELTHIRACPLDERRPQPPPVGLAPVMRGALTVRPQQDHLNYVLLAACRNDEKAREDLVGDPHQRHGLFTYWLLDVLRRQSPHQSVTYRTLYDQVRHCLHRGDTTNADETQTPQCEGDRDRFFLGDLRAVRNRWVTVVAEREGLIWIDSGQAHGMSVGALLHLYPPGVDIATAGTPLMTLQVEVVEATRSGCIRVGSPPWMPIPLGAQAFIYDYGVLNKRIKVALDFIEGMLLNAIRKRLLQPDIYDEIELAFPDESASLRVTIINGNTFAIQRGDRQQTYQLYPPGPQGSYRSGDRIHNLEVIVRDLHHLVKQMQIGAIASAPGSEIVADLQITLERLLPATPDALFPTTPVATAGQVMLLPVDTPLVLRITNGYARPLYITVLELGYTGDVRRIYPTIAGANEAVAPGKTLLIGATADPAAQMIMRLPPEIAQVEERFKVIATTQEANFDHLLQAELPSRQPVMRSGHSQQLTVTTYNAFPRVSDIFPEEQWGAIDVRVRVVRTLSAEPMK